MFFIQVVKLTKKLFNFLIVSKNNYPNRYQSNIHSHTSKIIHNFYLEKKDGTLMEQTIDLNDSVENVLQHMASALLAVGGVRLPPKPSSMSNSNDANNTYINQNHLQNDQEWFNMGDNFGWSSFPNKEYRNSFPSHMKHIDRDFIHFVKNIQTKEILQRKTNRLDAQAAALVARRAFHFQSIDGTRIGWSSESMAKLLSSLANFHSEHHMKFRTKSFYPMYLEMSCDEGQDKICLHSGRILLNPSSTPLQWLEIFMKITMDTLDTVRNNNKKLVENTKMIQEILGIQIKKGQSCEMKDYHEFLDKLSQHLRMSSNIYGLYSYHKSNGSSVSLKRLQVIVESHYACRRGKVTNEGHIQIGAGMPIASIVSYILNPTVYQTAHEKTVDEMEYIEKCNHLIQQICHQFGVRQIYRVRISSLTSLEMYDCLLRIYEKLHKHNNETENDNDDGLIYGHSLGIISKGQFCHLGDDGSIIIPSNFH